jgi:hypothetical protein
MMLVVLLDCGRTYRSLEKCTATFSPQNVRVHFCLWS